MDAYEKTNQTKRNAFLYADDRKKDILQQCKSGPISARLSALKGVSVQNPPKPVIPDPMMEFDKERQLLEVFLSDGTQMG